jgi:cysteine desulfurase
MIYLDHNSTTPMLPQVAAAMAECYAAGYVNPASQHALGRQARQRLEAAREAVARHMGAATSGMAADRVIFTSGGTEANNLAVLGLAAAAERRTSPPHEAILSAIEHPSVARCGELLAQRGWRIRLAPVDRHGQVLVDVFAQLLSPQTRFASVMLANNETGVAQPVAELASLCAANGMPLHTDAVQAVGKIPVDFTQLGVSALTLAAHKVHGPVGVGALVLRHGVVVEPLMVGGFQQEGLRPGTEAVALAVGLQAALELAARDQPSRGETMQALRDRLQAALLEQLPDVSINGLSALRVPGTLNVAFEGLDRQAVVMALDVAGIACSTGSACASGSAEPSGVLRAMSIADAAVAGSVRFSLGATTTRDEIDRAIEVVVATINRMRLSSAAARGTRGATRSSGSDAGSIQ